MKINSENAKRQRMIARQMKSRKSLVGLLAGLAVGAAISGCTSLPLQRDSCVTTIMTRFKVPEGAGIPIGEYTQLQLPDMWAYCECRCEDGRCYLAIYVDGGREEFDVTEQINRMLKSSGSSGIIIRGGLAPDSKPELSVWPLREDLALVVGEVIISGEAGERFSHFYLQRWTLLRKGAK